MSEKNEELNTNETEVKVSRFDKAKEIGHDFWVKAKPVVKAAVVGFVAGATILGITGYVASRKSMDELVESDESEEPETEEIPFEEDSEMESSEEQ